MIKSDSNFAQAFHDSSAVLAPVKLCVDVITVINIRVTYSFSCDQPALWLVLSACPSVRHNFFTMFPWSYHHVIFRSYYHGYKWCPCKNQGQRSKVKVTEVNTQLSRFRTLTPVWIHICQWNHAHYWSSIEEVPYCFSMSSVKFQGHTSKVSSILTRIERFRTLT